MQIIGTRRDSTWRVPADFYMQKQRFMPGVDVQTGGPVMVVEDFTDEPCGYMVDTDSESRTYRQIVPETRENPPRREGDMHLEVQYLKARMDALSEAFKAHSHKQERSSENG